MTRRAIVTGSAVEHKTMTAKEITALAAPGATPAPPEVATIDALAARVEALESKSALGTKG